MEKRLYFNSNKTIDTEARPLLDTSKGSIDDTQKKTHLNN